MAVLGAGTFSNLAFALIFFGLFVGFFYLSFSPAGYQFTDYAYSIIPKNVVTEVSIINENLTEIYVGDAVFYWDAKLKEQIEQNLTNIIAYDNTPAFNAGLKGVIYEIDGTEIFNQENLQKFLENKNPGDFILIKTLIIITHHKKL